ncbi:MAG: DNA internalization-related competence protein ComEC/Rec2 [Pseudomonadota bacterium]
MPRSWLLAGLVLCLVALRLYIRKGLKDLILPAAMIVTFMLSAVNIHLYFYEKPDPGHIVHHAGPDILTIEGLITAPPKHFPEKTQMIVSAQRLRTKGAVIPVHGNILLNCVTGASLQYGQIIRFKTKLKIPHNFYNPGRFDYEKHLRFKDILVHGFISNPTHIVMLRENQGHPLRMQIEAFRYQLKTIIRTYSGSPTGEIIQALILGDQHEIPKTVREQFNRTGVSHILAISGFHVGIIAFFSILMVRMIMRTSEYLLLRFNITKVSMALSFIPVAVFALIAGMGISVVRATLMAFAFLVAIFLGKERDLYHVLALAALLILVACPPSLFDISFQLSFSAVAAILFITPKLTALIPKPPREGRPKTQLFIYRRLYDIALFVIVSVSATLGTLPLVIFNFNRISLITIPANLVVVPILGLLALPVCMAIVPAALLSTTLTIWLVKLSSLLVEMAVLMVDYFASISWAAYYVFTPNAIEIIAYVLLLLILFSLIDNRTKRRHALPSEIESLSRRSRKLKGALAGLMLFLSGYLLYSHLIDTQNRDLRITAIDVGQGSSTLIRFPGGKKMLIDGGGFFNDEFDIGRYVVAPFLWHQKIRKIDIVVLTHVHPDHLNGLKFIVENFDVGEVWSNGQEADTESFQTFRRTITERNIPFRRVSAATPPIQIDEVNVRILNPLVSAHLDDDWNTYDGINNHSLVTKLAYGAVGILLPADISERTEARLVRQGVKINSDVLFVPHHGSLTSSTEPFLDAVHPRIAIVSCGKDNIFRFPHPVVLDRCDVRKIRVLRTDRDGAVTVATDGGDLRIHTFNQRRFRAVMGPASPDDR